MTIRRVAVWLALAAMVAGAAYVRLAPVDPDLWHAELGSLVGELQGQPAGSMQVGRNSAAIRLEGDPAQLQTWLLRLDEIALATARTRRLAGDPAKGWVTWETRSLIFGFPDYTTARIVDGNLVLFARARFGRGDRGVNAARLTDWLSKL